MNYNLSVLRSRTTTKDEPGISIIIPTLNSEKVIGTCLDYLIRQDYPRKLIEIIIADGGSNDDTLDIVKSKLTDFTVRIVKNKLKTGEAGKARGAKDASKEIILFLDSDNLLEDKNWLQKMVEPFRDPDIAATEPLYYTYRKEDGLITRYCALLGMNDPLCYFLGNYDRYSLLSGKWTEMPVKEEDIGSYLKITILNEQQLPTIGANGFLIRRKDLDSCSPGDYLFDIDIIYKLLKQGRNKFAKVKTGLVHVFSGNLRTFIRKQRRRIEDYQYFSRQGLREYPWTNLDKNNLCRFIIYCLLIFPLFLQAGKGFFKKPDKAWFFHPLACEITLWVYGTGKILGWFRKEMFSREKWS